MQQLAFGIDEAAALIGLSPWTLRKYISTGKLSVVKIGRRTLIERAELERLVEEGRIERHEQQGF